MASAGSFRSVNGFKSSSSSSVDWLSREMLEMRLKDKTDHHDEDRVSSILHCLKYVKVLHYLSIFCKSQVTKGGSLHISCNGGEENGFQAS